MTVRLEVGASSCNKWMTQIGVENNFIIKPEKPDHNMKSTQRRDIIAKNFFLRPKMQACMKSRGSNGCPAWVHNGCIDLVTASPSKTGVCFSLLLPPFFKCWLLRISVVFFLLCFGKQSVDGSMKAMGSARSHQKLPRALACAAAAADVGLAGGGAVGQYSEVGGEWRDEYEQTDQYQKVYKLFIWI